MPFSRRIGLSTSAWSTSSSTMGRRSAATRPAKPRPTRDADAALHLLLDPDGRAGDKFARLPVQQQHRARVHVEELARPQEERGEQLFEVEMRERGIRQCLEPAKALRVLRSRHGRSVPIASPQRRVVRGLAAHNAHSDLSVRFFPVPRSDGNIGARRARPIRLEQSEHRLIALRRTTLASSGSISSLGRAVRPS